MPVHRTSISSSTRNGKQAITTDGGWSVAWPSIHPHICFRNTSATATCAVTDLATFVQSQVSARSAVVLYDIDSRLGAFAHPISPDTHIYIYTTAFTIHFDPLNRPQTYFIRASQLQCVHEINAGMYLFGTGWSVHHPCPAHACVLAYRA